MAWFSTPETGSRNPEYDFSKETITKGARENIANIEASKSDMQARQYDFETGRQIHVDMMAAAGAADQEEGK